MSAVPNPIPARHKDVNRAKVCDENFVEFVRNWNGKAAPRPKPEAPVLPGTACTAADFVALFESQLISRHLDLMALVLRVQQKVFYHRFLRPWATPVARLARHRPAFTTTAPATSQPKRFRKLPGMDRS
jgi:2-oxoisovalerate dehydrogenase E1 component